MCGRYSFFTKEDVLEERFHAHAAEALPFRYNAAPTQRLPVITGEQPDRIQLGRWGLKPRWFTQNETGFINARSETLTEKPSFCNAVKLRRCLVITNGFFEWDRAHVKKQPYRITVTSDSPFAFAGLWEYFLLPDRKRVPGFTIITTPANELVGRIHNRMPAILTPDEERAWLSSDTRLEDALEMLQPYPPGQLAMFPVSGAVNSVRNEGPEVIQPIK